MIKRSIGLLVLVLVVSACSSAPVVPVLNGKKRERINTVIYDKAPLVAVQSSIDRYNDTHIAPPIKKKPLPIVTNRVVEATPKTKPAKVIVDHVVKTPDVIEVVEKIEGVMPLLETANSVESSSSVVQEKKVSVDSKDAGSGDENKSADSPLAIPVRNDDAVTEPSEQGPVKVRAVKAEKDESTIDSTNLDAQSE